MQRSTRASAATCAALEGVDLIAWLAGPDGAPAERDPASADRAAEAVIERDGAELRFRPGHAVTDLRGAGWDVDGDLAVIDAVLDGAVVSSPAYPTASAGSGRRSTRPRPARS